MNKYKILDKHVYTLGKYSIVPIRMEDRYDIMRWRNEQMYHLRQNKPLTLEEQDRYFDEVVSKLFDQDKPDQILFSYLEGEKCIGYGGLVYINWIDLNGEISFVMDTAEEQDNFEIHWVCFLNLIKRVAFKGLVLNKIHTYAFDVRPRLYDALYKAGFSEEARLAHKCLVYGELHDVLIHRFMNPLNSLSVDYAQLEDVNLFYDWANDSSVRANALNSDFIPYENHVAWFKDKLNSDKSDVLIFRSDGSPVGQVRLDLIEDHWGIDYSVDAKYRGLGLGEIMIQKVLDLFPERNFLAIVKRANTPSQKVFEKLMFKHSMAKGLQGSELYHQYLLTR